MRLVVPLCDEMMSFTAFSVVLYTNFVNEFPFAFVYFFEI